MKNTFKLFAAATTFLTVFSCTHEQPQPAEPVEKLVTLTLVSDNVLATDNTKTVLNEDNSVSWSNNESIRVFEVADGNNANAATAGSDATIDESTGIATFKASFNVKENVSRFTYYSVYPESSWTSGNKNIEDMRIAGFANDQGVQCPTKTSFDPETDRLISKVIESESQERNTPLPLQFIRISALGKMTLAGLSPEESVTEIAFIAPEKTILDGDSFFDLTSYSVAIDSETGNEKYGQHNESNRIRLAYDHELKFNNNTAYFMCWPAKVTDRFIVVVKTDACTYVKDVNMPSNSIEFYKGEASAFTINLSESKVEDITIKEFLTKPVGSKYYRLTGTMSDITSATTYGNFNITDGTGSVKVYGLTQHPNIYNDKTYSKLGLAAGDEVTIIGTKTEYNSAAQVGGPAFYESHITASFDPTSLTFDAEATESTTKTLTLVTNADMGKITFELSDEENFTKSVNDNIVTIAPKKANSGETAYTATLTAKYSGKVIATATITQNKPIAEGGIPIGTILYTETFGTKNIAFSTYTGEGSSTYNDESTLTFSASGENVKTYNSSGNCSNTKNLLIGTINSWAKIAGIKTHGAKKVTITWTASKTYTDISIEGVEGKATSKDIVGNTATFTLNENQTTMTLVIEANNKDNGRIDDIKIIVAE